MSAAKVQAADVQLGAWLQRAWIIYRRNFGALFTLNLFALALLFACHAAAAALQAFVLPAARDAISPLSLLAAFLGHGLLLFGFVPFITPGLYLLNLRAAEGESELSVAAAFKILREGFGFYFPMLRYVIFGVFVFGGAIVILHGALFGLAHYADNQMVFVSGYLLYIPLLFFVFAPLYLVDRQVPVLAALGASFRTVKPRFWRLLRFYVAAALLAASGLLAFGVGLLFTAPLFGLLTAVAYRNCSAEAAA